MIPTRRGKQQPRTSPPPSNGSMAGSKAGQRVGEGWNKRQMQRGSLQTNRGPPSGPQCASVRQPDLPAGRHAPGPSGDEAADCGGPGPSPAPCAIRDPRLRRLLLSSRRLAPHCPHHPQEVQVARPKHGYTHTHTFVNLALASCWHQRHVFPLNMQWNYKARVRECFLKQICHMMLHRVKSALVITWGELERIISLPLHQI